MAYRPDALLPQPGGFEGWARVVVGGDAKDPAVPERPDVEEVVPDLGVASLHPSAVADGRDDSVLVRVEHFLELDMKVLDEQHHVGKVANAQTSAERSWP